MHGPLRQPTVLRPMLVVLLGLSFTALTWYYTDRAERRRIAEDLVERANRNVESLRDYMDDSLAPLAYVAALSAEPDLGARRLRRLLDGALGPETPLRYVAWAPHVPDSEMAGWEVARQAGRPG
ncbi:MAG TPA: hypothetical protein VFD43_01870, partial [Planctomycetota bacterium]|nr:hypothetical protein [Planctomycetota bacterium]